MGLKAIIVGAGVLACALWGGCSEKAAKTAQTEAPRTASPAELTLPYIPETLTSAQERGSFLAVHFWDALDSLVPALRADTALMEQTFANFAELLRYVDEPTRSKSVGTLIEKCAADSASVRLIEYLAQKYLDNPNSPMRSEDIYLHFLRGFSTNALLPEDVRFRGEFQLERALMNRPGTRAVDFGLVTRGGVNSTLLGQVAGDTTVVMFYDPDCQHCREITARLAASTMPYRILAVDVAGDRGLWEASKSALPADWAVAYATTAVEDEDLYSFPALPTFYLLAPDGTVILKDFTIRL